MQVATNEGKVVLSGSCLPTDWNGLTLTVYTLTADQEAAFSALRADRKETHFDGVTFTAVGTVVQE